MATFRRFEDIEAWQAAKLLCSKILEIIQQAELGRDYALRNQIDASSGSVMDNIAEGFGRGGNAEFINFLTIAHGSACESQSQLYRLLERKYIDEKKFKEIYAICDEAKNKITGLIKYLQKTTLRGPKYIRR
jgi:four helix bundle protein